MRYVPQLMPGWTRTLAVQFVGLVVLFALLAGAVLTLPADSPAVLVLGVVFVLYVASAPVVFCFDQARRSPRKRRVPD